MAEGQSTLLTFANDGPGGLITHKHFESHILVPPKIPQFSQCLPFPTQDLGVKHRIVCACACAGSGMEDVSACSQSCNASHTHMALHTNTTSCTASASSSVRLTPASVPTRTETVSSQRMRQNELSWRAGMPLLRLLSAALPKGSGLAPTLVTQREGENFGQPWNPWLRKGWKARGQRGEVREKGRKKGGQEAEEACRDPEGKSGPGDEQEEGAVNLWSEASV